MRLLVTGTAGFIGYHAALKFLKNNDTVFGIDSINDYYDPIYKLERLKQLEQFKSFSFEKTNLENKTTLDAVFAAFKPTHFLHLAAQAGVRYSIENPDAYITANVVGFQNV